MQSFVASLFLRRQQPPLPILEHENLMNGETEFVPVTCKQQAATETEVVMFQFKTEPVPVGFKQSLSVVMLQPPELRL